MCTALLGDQIDIHCGAVDNIFPHHEAEIAQSESVTGKRFVRYWLHCAHLMVDGQKMSKKLGNFYTLRDLLEKGWTGREIRYALLSVNYRLPLNFTLEGLAAARAAVARIDAFVDRLKERAADSVPAACPAFAAERVEAFFSQLDDDLNISAALAELFELIRAVNAQCDADSLSPQEAAAILAAWHRVDSVLCIARPELAVPPEVTALLNARSTARAAKEWAQSDRLRDEIAALGWLLKDTKEGQKVTPMTT
jgi:cysteinyl-tRNA synthetase